MNENDVPVLDLAPKLDKPLRLWNPLDYLRLLYWVFYFPQAIRWYVETFGEEQPATEPEGVRGQWQQAIQFLTTATPQRNLWLQGVILIITTLFILSGLLAIPSVPIVWKTVALVVALVVTVGVAKGVVGGVAKGVAYFLMAIMAFGAAGSLTKVVALGVEGSLAFGVALVGALFGVVFGVVFGVEEVVAKSMGGAVAEAVAVLGGSFVGALFVVVLGVQGSLAFGVAFIVAFGVVSLRIDDYLIGMTNLKQIRRQQGRWGRITPLSGRQLQKQVEHWLNADPNQAIQNINQLLAYTLQFISIQKALVSWLAHLPEDKILQSINLMVTYSYNWNLIRYCSASLSNTLRASVEDIRLIGKWYINHYPKPYEPSLQFSTPWQAASAGFWLLHRKKLADARDAFSHVRQIPFGEELYQSTSALHSGTECTTIRDIVNWQSITAWTLASDTTFLRPDAVATLARLHDIATECGIALESLSRLNRNAALGRATAAITTLINDVDDTCPYPEAPIVKEIATTWRDIIAEEAGAAGELAAPQVIDNPFVVGNPVRDQLFVGRDPVLQRLEELWGSDPSKPVLSVVLYGHRRMGKTSILQNLGQRFGRDTILVYFTMQSLGSVRHTQEFLYAVALRIFDKLEDRGLSIEEPSEAAFASSGYIAFDRFLRSVHEVIGKQRLILTLDEFEELEKAINRGEIESQVLNYLRSLIQEKPWFILALAGLHTLEEMTRSYWNPLFAGVTPVHVGFINETATGRLLANPTDDFPLDISRDTAARAFYWTQGQPTLVQLVGHSLVRRYNAQLQEGLDPSIRFSPEDIDTVIASPEFYEQGNQYFSGVWDQVTDLGESASHMLVHLAKADAALPSSTLIQASVSSPTDAHDTLLMLQKRDILRRTSDSETSYDFTVPLMRRWLRQQLDQENSIIAG